MRAGCVYCGAPEALSVDHVPPRNLFPKPHPSNFVTVPSCPACNAGFQQDDDYFRQSIVLRAGVATAPSAKQVLDAVMRNLRRPEAKGLFAATVASMRQVAIRSPGGLHLGSAPGFVVSTERIERTLNRIVRGLYYHHTRTALASEAALRVHLEPRQDAELMQMVADTFAVAPPVQTIGEVFRYRYAIASDNPLASVWALEFYGTVLTLGLTVAPRTAPPALEGIDW